MQNRFQRTLKHDTFLWLVVLAMAFGLCGAISAAGQTRVLGTPGAGFHPAAIPQGDPLDQINPFKTYTNASYGTGGVGLRNRGAGVIEVSGVTGRVQDAYLYWAILFNTPQPDKWLYHVQLTRVIPWGTILPINLEGTLIGIGADPCWGSTGIAVFRARVPKSIAIGNGAYGVEVASGRVDGSDPWLTSLVFPLAEGASLVIIGTGTYTVGIYDTGFTASTFQTTYTYTLNLPGTVTTDALWDNIGADGQTGGGSPGGARDDNAETSLETTTINTVLISGAGGVDNDSDWNGSSGFPVPELWDDKGHDIFSAVSSSTTAEITFSANDDCLTTVANVLAVQ
jgi:hypothetical protein